ncbi:hypothetical protein RRG08_067099 [Elysia crispata]|uniref:Uncharacterized protein n=1 Tax=Elysia crispata TaxID=231223 RepID=A0AAE1B990_9GAST|nr:hypothetical protein RRG08_067099 [Elysia crispata]
MFLFRLLSTRLPSQLLLGPSVLLLLLLVTPRPVVAAPRQGTQQNKDPGIAKYTLAQLMLLQYNHIDLYWFTVQTHRSLLVYSTNTSISTGLQYKHIDLYWFTVQTHRSLLVYSTNTSISTGL